MSWAHDLLLCSFRGNFFPCNVQPIIRKFYKVVSEINLLLKNGNLAAGRLMRQRKKKKRMESKARIFKNVPIETQLVRIVSLAQLG